MSKKGNEELPQKSSENQNSKKTNKGTKPFRPQVFMVGDGFPAPLQKAFDILSPNPIDGVRVPLEKLFKELQKMALGVSRLGPLTGTQIANDLKAPYATIAGNALMAGLMIAFAQKEQFNKELFQSMQKAILKELREYFGLKELMLQEYRLSSGKIPEPADPGIPYAPEKYAPEKLTQMTSDLSKLANTTRETLVRHQKEWENFDKTAAPIVSERMLRESPASKELDTRIENLKNHPRVKENPELLEVSKNIAAAREQILKENTEELNSIKPLSEKEFDMIQKSYEATGEKLPENQAEKKAAMASLTRFLTTMKSEIKVDTLNEETKLIQTDMDNKTIAPDDTIKKSGDVMKSVNAKIPDISTKTGVMAGRAKKSSGIQSEVKENVHMKHKNDLEELRKHEAELVSNMADVTKGVTVKPDSAN